MLTIQHNLDDLGRVFARYRELFSKGREAALRKMAHNFGVYGQRRLKEIAPDKGAIREANLARLKAKAGGLTISDRARALVYKRYGVAQSTSSKKLYIAGTAKKGGLTKRQAADVGAGGNLQSLLVKQELNLRESHRAFLASSLRFVGAKLGGTSYSLGKGSTKLAQAREINAGEKDTFEFTWGGEISKASGQAATGLKLGKAQSRIAAALNDTRLDMLKYIRGEHTKAAQAAAGSIH